MKWFICYLLVNNWSFVYYNMSAPHKYQVFIPTVVIYHIIKYSSTEIVGLHKFLCLKACSLTINFYQYSPGLRKYCCDDIVPWLKKAERQILQCAEGFKLLKFGSFRLPHCRRAWWHYNVTSTNITHLKWLAGTHLLGSQSCCNNYLKLCPNIMRKHQLTGSHYLHTMLSSNQEFWTFRL